MDRLKVMSSGLDKHIETLEYGMDFHTFALISKKMKILLSKVRERTTKTRCSNSLFQHVIMKTNQTIVPPRKKLSCS